VIKESRRRKVKWSRALCCNIRRSLVGGRRVRVVMLLTIVNVGVAAGHVISKVYRGPSRLTVFHLVMTGGGHCWVAI
jgi:hypothetical protein